MRDFAYYSLSMKIHYPLLTVAISALGALVIVVPSVRHLQAAQEKSSGSAVTQTVGERAIPIKDVGEFDQVFTAKLNQAIAESGTARKGTTIFSHHIIRGFITDCLYKCDSARVASKEELTKLRDAIGAELKQAQSRKASINELAKGQITNSFFVGTVRKAGAAPKSE